MTISFLSVDRWQYCDSPLIPQATIAWGETAERLLDSLQSLSPEHYQPLAVTAGPQWLIVSGEAESLPWEEGVAYAASCPQHPELWLPTQLQPIGPIDLISRAVTRYAQSSPVLLWPEPARIIPLQNVLPLSADILLYIRQQWNKGSM